MMTIKIRAYAGMGPGAGLRERAIETSDGERVADVLAEMRSLLAGATYLIAINRQQATEDDVLRDGDELTLIPAMSAGR